ncbi:collagen type XVIII alpha 1 chain a isoform X4 [Tachysurus ichikawai]
MYELLRRGLKELQDTGEINFHLRVYKACVLTSHVLHFTLSCQSFSCSSTAHGDIAAQSADEQKRISVWTFESGMADRWNWWLEPLLLCVLVSRAASQWTVDESELRRKITEEVQKGLEEERSKTQYELHQW